MWRPIGIFIIWLIAGGLILFGGSLGFIRHLLVGLWWLTLIMLPISIIREIRSGGRAAWGLGVPLSHAGGSSSYDDDDEKPCPDHKKPSYFGDYLPPSNRAGLAEKTLWIVIALAMGIGFAACGPAPASIAIPPQTQAASLIYNNPTSTATQALKMATATMMPPPTSTLTPEPMVLGALNPYLTSIGDHGAMICLKPDHPNQLDRILLKANLSQEGQLLDQNIVPEKIGDHEGCFEVIDAKYTLGTPVSIQIIAQGKGITVTNAIQSTKIVNYGILDPISGNWLPYPSMYPLFRESEVKGLPDLIDKNHADPHFSHGHPFYAHDLEFGIEGTPDVKIYPPSTLQINWVDKSPNITWSIIATNPYTGYMCLFEHIKITEETAIPLVASKSSAEIMFTQDWFVPYNSETPLALISEPNNIHSTIAHLHIECINPLKPVEEGKNIYDMLEWKGFKFVRANSVYGLPTLPSIEITPLLLEGWIK